MKESTATVIVLVALCVTVFFVTVVVQTQMTERTKFEHGYVQKLAPPDSLVVHNNGRLWVKP